MSLAEIREQLTNRLADAVGAQSKYTLLPEEPPQRFPAVVTKWVTMPLRVRYGNVPTGARHRQHDIEGIVIINQRSMLPDEDARAIQLAEAVLESFEDDGTLNGTVSKCDLMKVEPITIQYGEGNQGLAFYSLRCAFTIIETTT